MPNSSIKHYYFHSYSRNSKTKVATRGHFKALTTPLDKLVVLQRGEVGTRISRKWTPSPIVMGPAWHEIRRLPQEIVTVPRTPNHSSTQLPGSTWRWILWCCAGDRPIPMVVHVSRAIKKEDVGRSWPGYTGSIHGPWRQGPRKKGKLDHASRGSHYWMLLLGWWGLHLLSSEFGFIGSTPFLYFSTSCGPSK